MEDGSFTPNSVFGGPSDSAMDLNFMDELLFEGCWLETTDGFSFLQPGASTSSALNDSSHHSLTFENPYTPQKSYGDDGQRSSLPENPPPFYPQAEGLVGTQSDNWKTFEAATASGQSESFLVERTELNRRLWIGPSANPGPVSSVKNRLILAIRNLREFTKERDVLIQIWVPIERGGKNVLTTNDQPFSLDPDCQSLANYRNVSENYHFPAEEDSKEQVGLPGRVFLGKVPEWTPDVRFFKSEEYPRINYAQRYNVRGSLALPVFERGSGVCLGVIEIVTTTQKINYRPELENVCKALEAVDLRSSEVLIPPVKACNELYQAALPEILKVLARVCRTHRLPLAQTWAPCIQQGKGGCRHSDKNYALFLSTVDHAYYVTDPKFKGFNEACFDHHLFRGQGVVGRALTTNQPCFESDITAFSKTEYPLSHHARMFGLRAAVAIRLKSIYNGSADFILEFFLPTDCQETEEQKQVLNSLSIVIQQTCQIFRVVTEKDLEKESILPVGEILFASDERVKQEGSVKLLSPPIKEPSREESSWIAHMMEAQKKGKGVSVSLEYQKEEPEEEFKVTTNWDNTEVELHETKRARSNVLVGQYVLKEFEGNGIFLGKIMYYDGGLYRVDYEDGDCEDLESSELCSFIMEDAYFDDDLTERRKKLDELILKRKNISAMKLVESGNGVERVEASLVSDLSDVLIHEVDSVEMDGEADSSSDSCEYARDREFGSDAETPMVPPPQLPPSSGNIGVPEEYVSHLFSVYGFLCSFSIRLFLSPFALDDLVGSLNCTVPNTLLDAIHVALLRVVRRHLEALSSSGSELASKCLWCIDWSLVDTLTWPVYLVQYLTIMGYTKGLELKGFYADVLDREYYTLSAGRKLIILKILCDDVLDSEELRAEIDIREESEIGIDPDSVTNFPPENGPRRVHPRYSKTSACKDQEAMQIIAESHETKLSRNSNSLGFKTTELDVNAADDQDVNGDECRLCGMDGTLLCCDGCPSVYHSRCIGVSKMFIPDGPWFCPECTIDKIGPTITVGTSLRGAEVFGIDAFEQVYLGTCNHLLVLKASIDAETCVRYYHQNDILKVIQVLCSSEQYAALYSGICKAILKYWEIKENVLLVPEIVEMDPTLANKKDGATIRPLSLPPPGIVNQKVLDTVVEGENCLSSITESNIKNVAVSCIETSWDTMTRTGYLGLQRNSDTTAKQICPLMIPKLPEQIKMESTMSTSSTSQQVDRSDLTQQSLADRSSGMDFATCLSGNSNSSNSGYMTGVCFPENLSSQSKSGNLRIVGRVKRNTVDDCTYMGAFFKSYAYINNYAHGDFAASAAANLAILSSEENRVSEVQASSNPRKVLSANISLQVKAFSSVANRFFWPNSEKKLVEVPRERCGWCLSCKASVSSKRGCLLNSAALNAIKGAMKILAGIRPLKNVEGNLPSIATYILYMEESLSGLVVGPFLSATCRKQWRRRVEQASTYSVIKALLLELEENIRIIALSGDWVKLVDNWLVEASVTQSATSATGSTQKRGPGRRSKRLSGVSEVADDRCLDKDFTWWRGGKLSKHIFQRGILPCSAVKKAARQGGSRKIPGICYAEVSEIPKRSRQVIWRAAVEMSKNASQLALQVRYLDLHIRWGDLVRPEQNIQDVKGPETEASAFRNAFICDKKIVENKIRYGVAFGNQKHLPSRVMKNIIEVEQIQDGNDKYWFYEMRIPLYLIKEYEESVETLLLSDKQPSNVLSKLQRLQLKASRRDIFSYLMRKRDNLDKCSCASCQLDVLLGSAVKCGACQGYCHEDCTISSTIQSTEEVEFLITCKQCYHAKTPTQNENSNDSPTSPLPLLGREYQNTATAPKGSRQKDYSQPLAYVRAPENCSNMQQTAAGSSLATKSRRKPCSWGLIWKKKNVEDSGIDFRLKNILLRGNPDTNWSRPVCHLCHQPYNSDLMYICCETCKNWYHAEAVELEESKILEVVGFKCCKCRRIRSPVCPYMDQELKKVEVKKPRLRTSKSGNPGMDSISGPIFEHLKEWEPNTPMSQTEEEVVVEDDDPLLFSRSRVEQITEHDTEVDFERNAAGPGPQKLPVRRHMKRENEVDGLSGNDQCQIESNHHLNTAELASSPHLEWDASIDGLEDEMIFDYENMEFEPQTYFSFTELLASDDGGQLDGIDASNWENLSYGISQDKVPEQCGMGTSCNQQQPTNFEEPAVNIMQCRMCSKTEPSPSLSCQICGLWIHSHCSPWVEESSWEDGWRCGNCREWR